MTVPARFFAFALLMPAIALAAAPKPALPFAPAGTYVIDKAHSRVTANIHHADAPDYRVHFDRYEARLRYDPAHPEASRIEVTLQPHMVARPAPAPNWRMQADMLAAGMLPAITFTSTSLRPTAPGKAVLTGTASFLRLAHPVAMEVDLKTFKRQNRTVIGLSGTTSIHVPETPLPALRGLTLGGDMAFDIDVEFVRS